SRLRGGYFVRVRRCSFHPSASVWKTAFQTAKVNAFAQKRIRPNLTRRIYQSRIETFNAIVS
ncbi:hypothetical protein M4D48_22435, partial [Alkalihalobacillus clausii]|uniref:hypothetical protein n=1 Tax=Shouchella clausii TaxID=79880 RepID=UPI00203E4F6A